MLFSLFTGDLKSLVKVVLQTDAKNISLKDLSKKSNKDINIQVLINTKYSPNLAIYLLIYNVTLSSLVGKSMWNWFLTSIELLPPSEKVLAKNVQGGSHNVMRDHPRKYQGPIKAHRAGKDDLRY